MGGGYDFPGIHSISVDPRDPRRVLAGVSTGGAWLTESRPSGPGCPNGTPIISSTATGWRWHGRTLAMGSTTGALWLSRDAGDSWTGVSRDLPPVCCVR